MKKGTRFSFSRMINNAVPNFARDDPNDVDLPPGLADDLLRYQLSLPYPRYLDERSFWIAGIAQNKPYSTKVYKALVKAHIILPVPSCSISSSSAANSAGEPMTVNTAAIGKGFASQLAVISVHAQRKLVGMLFFWEEECTRWNLLDAEEREILRALDKNPGNVDLEVALEAVKMRKNLLPSQGAEGTANVTPGAGHKLPSYSDRQT